MLNHVINIKQFPGRVVLFFTILLVFQNPSPCQFFDIGQDPASLKWKQINTDHFKIIFPDDFSTPARKVAGLMESNYRRNSEQLNHYPKKIPVIIHNQSVYSNAFVTLGPRRIEFFTFPAPELYATDWLEDLCLHEFRHVIQIDKLNQKFTRYLSFIFGQQANGFAAGMIPLWFYEGDAVFAETSLSNSGRGRLPSFQMDLKAILVSEKKIYSLSKAYLGSYKDHVPNYYTLGYQLIDYGITNYGNDFWKNAMEYSAGKIFLLNPLNFYTRKITGSWNENFYSSSMKYLKSKWSDERSSNPLPEAKIINNPDKNSYTSYIRPVFENDTAIIAVKKDFTRIPRIIRMNMQGKEEILHIPGHLVTERISCVKDKVIWDEYVQDPRWGNRSFSVLKILNIKTLEIKQLTKKTRYLSPSWSPGGDTIIAVSADPEYTFSLVFINPQTGKLISKISSPSGYYLQYPSWIPGTGRIAVIATGEEGKILYEYDTRDNRWIEILKTGSFNIDQLTVTGNYLVFNAAFTGTDQIFCWNRKTGILNKLSNVTFGAFYPDINDNESRLIYSTYGSKGYDIVLSDFNPLAEPEYEIPDGELTETDNLKGEDRTKTTNNDSLENYISIPESKYSKVFNLFKIHSWSPFWYDYLDPNIDDPLIRPGITLLSQNLLSTAVSTVGLEHYDGTNYFHAGFTYKGMLPVIDLSARYGGIPLVAKVENTEIPKLDPDLYYTASAYIPLTLSSGRIITGIQPSVRLSHSSTYYYVRDEEKYIKGIDFFEPRLFFYSYERTAVRDLQPKFGITLDARYSSAPFESGLYGSKNSFRLSVYLPGVIQNQGFRFRTEKQSENVESYYFQNHLILPRGYLQRTFISMNKFSADYVFPVAYPDLSLSSVLYVKRIRADLFLDYMKGTEKYVTQTRTSEPEFLLSQGLELYADYHLFRFLVEFNSGIRISYLPYEKALRSEILFSVDLDSF